MPPTGFSRRTAGDQSVGDRIHDLSPLCSPCQLGDLLPCDGVHIGRVNPGVCNEAVEFLHQAFFETMDLILDGSNARRHGGAPFDSPS